MQPAGVPLLLPLSIAIRSLHQPPPVRAAQPEIEPLLPLSLPLAISCCVCRAVGLEVLYTVIQSLTADGRDRGLDYKLSGFHVPPGCWDAQVGGGWWC